VAGVAGRERGHAGEPVPEDVVGEPGGVGPAGGDLGAGGGPPGVEEVELGPGMGAQPVAQGGGGGAAGNARGGGAVAEDFELQLVAAAEELLGQGVVDALAEQGQPGEPEQAGGAVEARRGVAPVFAL